MSHASNWATIGNLVKLFIVGLIVIMVAKVVFAIGGIALGIVGALFGVGLAIALALAVLAVVAAFFFGPLILFGWVVMKGFRALTREPASEW